MDASAGRLMLLQLAVFMLASLVAAWMLSVTSDRILASYPRRVLFFAANGLMFALYGDLMRFGIDGYPLRDALMLAVCDIICWTVAGLVVAWRLKPEPGTVVHPQAVRV
jgi:hypothetical protein